MGNLSLLYATVAQPTITLVCFIKQAIPHPHVGKVVISDNQFPIVHRLEESFMCVISQIDLHMADLERKQMEV